MNLPTELINKIFSYIEGNTNQLFKTAIRKYYDKKLPYDTDNTNWSLIRITRYNTKIKTRKINNMCRERVLLGIKQFGNYQLCLAHLQYYTFNIIIKEICCKTDSNNMLLQRNILTDYIKQPNKRRKRSGTKTNFIKSKANYIKRKTNKKKKDVKLNEN